MTVAYSSGVIGFGATLQYSSTVYTTTPTSTLGGTPVSVGQVSNISWSGAKTGEEDISNMGSPVDSNSMGWEEKISGMINPGSLSVEIVFDSKGTLYSALHAIIGVMKGWSLTLAGGLGEWNFNGFVSDCGVEIKAKNAISVKLTVTISGPVVFTPGT